MGKWQRRFWLLVPWFVPDQLVRFLPPWVTDNVERAVFDGMTRREWFAAQIAELHRKENPYR